MLFTADDVATLLSRFESCLDTLLHSKDNDDLSLLKTCQILVFNLAVHGIGSRKLWDSIIEIYDQKVMLDHKHNSGSYHVFSLIGFMLKTNYKRYEQAVTDDSEEAQKCAAFEERLMEFIQKYKEFSKKYIKAESLTLHKY